MNALQRCVVIGHAFIATVLGVNEFAFVTFSLSESLPERVFVVVRGQSAARGELVAYRWDGGAGYPAGTLMVKRRVGLPGDAITVNARVVTVGATPVGRAKETSRRGVVLAVITPSVVAAGTSFLAANHPDSLDSRYALTGLIRDQQLIGKAYALF